MEEDWDSPTGYSPIDTSTAQNTQWTPPPTVDNQRSRGRGFWRSSDQDQDWRRNDDSDMQNYGWRQTGANKNFNNENGFGESRPRGRGVLRDRDVPRRGRRGGFSQARQNPNWRETDPQDGCSSVKQSVVIKIDSNLVGKVIGRGGSKIRELQDNSGANIKVLKDGDSYGETDIEIFGSTEAQDKAKELIEELVNPVDRVTISLHSTSLSNGEVYQEPPRPKINWGQIMKDREENERKKFAGLPDIKKNFYIESQEVANMTPAEVDGIRRNNFNISVTNLATSGDLSIPNPVTTFEQAFEHYPEILLTIYKQRFTRPTPIQCQAWPVLLQGKDLIGIAQTGTGKTLAFLLPAFIHIDLQPVPREERDGPNVLVLSPTRELALQIEEEVKKFHYRGIKSVCVYGGGNRREQINVVTKGVEIIVATPGRLNDLVQNKIINVKSVTYLVSTVIHVFCYIYVGMFCSHEGRHLIWIYTICC